MTESTTRRRGRGEDAIYFDETKNRYVGAVSLGFGPDGKRIRRKVTGRTKQDVRDKVVSASRQTRTVPSSPPVTMTVAPSDSRPTVAAPTRLYPPSRSSSQSG